MKKRMQRSAKTAATESVALPISLQSFKLLEQLSRRGIYGRSPAEVAARFIDQALARFVSKPVLGEGKAA